MQIIAMGYSLAANAMRENLILRRRAKKTKNYTGDIGQYQSHISNL